MPGSSRHRCSRARERSPRGRTGGSDTSGPSTDRTTCRTTETCGRGRNRRGGRPSSSNPWRRARWRARSRRCDRRRTGCGWRSSSDPGPSGADRCSACGTPAPGCRRRRGWRRSGACAGRGRTRRRGRACRGSCRKSGSPSSRRRCDRSSAGCRCRQGAWGAGATRAGGSASAPPPAHPAPTIPAGSGRRRPRGRRYGRGTNAGTGACRARTGVSRAEGDSRPRRQGNIPDPGGGISNPDPLA